MLVLSRKVGERILIGDKISVTVVRISGGGVRIGIEAPAEMAVVREELQQEMLDARAADGLSPDVKSPEGRDGSASRDSNASPTVPQDSQASSLGSDSPRGLPLNGDRSGTENPRGAAARPSSSASSDQGEEGIPRSTRRKPR